MFRSLLLATALSSAASIGYAQTPTWQWAKALNGTGPNAINDMATDAQGNTYVAGLFLDQLPLSPTVTLSSSGRSDGFVAKYDAAGTLLWARTLAGAGSEDVQALALDGQGNVYFVGTFTTSVALGSLTVNGGITGRTYIGKIDAQGQPQWLRQDGFGPGTSGGSSAGDIAVDVSGALYVTGRYSGVCAFGGFTLAAAAATNEIYLVKYNAQGAPQGVAQWAVTGGRVAYGTGITTVYGHQIVVNPVGEVYLAWGANEQAGGFGQFSLAPTLGNTDVVVAKFSSQGAAQWLKRAGGSGLDRTTNLVLDRTGTLLVSGSSTGAATFGSTTLPGTGNEAGFLLQLEAGSGNFLWARQLSGTTSARYQGLATDEQDNVYAVGSVTGTGTIGQQTLTSAGGTDVVVASYSPQGTLRWVQQSGGTDDEQGHHLNLSGSRLVVAGNLVGAGQFGPSSISGLGSPTGFIASLMALPTATPAARALAPLTLYPNPARQRAWLQRPAELATAPAVVSLHNSLGQSVRTQALAAGSHPEIDLGGLPAGVYVLQLQSPTRRYAQRLVVE